MRYLVYLMAIFYASSAFSWSVKFINPITKKHELADQSMVVEVRNGFNINSSVDLLKLDSNGAIATEFGKKGWVTTKVSYWQPETYMDRQERFYVVATRKDSKNENVAEISRYSTDGLIDKTFGTLGTAVLKVNGLQPTLIFRTNEIILLTSHRDKVSRDFIPVAQRFDYNGRRLGRLKSLPDLATSQMVRYYESGSDIYVWRVASNRKLVLSRLTSNFKLDTSFADQGHYYNDDVFLWFFSNVFIDRLGRPYITTFHQSSPIQTVRRLDSTGKLDKLWGNNGIVNLNDGDWHAGYHDIILSDMGFDANGRIYLTGGVDVSGEHPRALMIALDETGGYDKSFGHSGVVVKDYGPSTDHYWAHVYGSVKPLSSGDIAYVLFFEGFSVLSTDPLVP